MAEVQFLADKTPIHQQCGFDISQELTVVLGQRRVRELGERDHPAPQMRELRCSCLQALVKFSPN